MISMHTCCFCGMFAGPVASKYLWKWSGIIIRCFFLKLQDRWPERQESLNHFRTLVVQKDCVATVPSQKKQRTKVGILKNGITLVHPYSRNKSDKWHHFYFLFLFLIHDKQGNNCVIDMSASIMTSHNIQHFQPQNSLQIESKTKIKSVKSDFFLEWIYSTFKDTSSTWGIGN